MTRKTSRDRRVTWGVAFAVALLLVLGAPALAGAADAPLPSGPIDATPAQRIVSSLESLWHSLLDAWPGIDVTTTAETGDGSDPDATTTADPCDPSCPDRNVDIDPDG